MVSVTINNVKYKVATNWNDITNLDALLECKTITEEIVVCSNIPKEVIDQLNETQLVHIATLLGFLNDEKEILDYASSIPSNWVVNVELESYFKFETARQCVSPKLYQSLIKIAKVYYPNLKDISYLLTYGMLILSQMEQFLANYESMFEGAEPKEEDISAGILDLTSFGAWGTAFTLAKDDILKMDAILNTPVIDVYTALNYSAKKMRYIENLNQQRINDITSKNS